MTPPFIEGLHVSADTVRDYPALCAADVPVPLRVDHRYELLESSNQGSTPQCAAYAVAGWIEYRRWKHDGVKEQVDPGPIYEGAKRIDGIHGPGTTLAHAIRAADSLGYLPRPMMWGAVTAAQVRRAIHQHDVVLAGFRVTDQWSSAAKDGWIRPGGEVLGGHAVLLCAYSSVPGDEWVGLQNSWGSAGYGWRGFCRLDWATFRKQFLYATAA